MTGTADPFRSRAATVFFSLAAAVAMALSNPATAGAACNQVCSDATSNTFFGDNAGVSTTSSGNSAFGFGALSGNTSGNFNTAFGPNSLASDTTGENNTATGAFTLEFNSTGSNNTANGEFALFENSAGSDNTAIGYETLLSNTTGNNNTANGYQALEVNATGNNDTANGSQALLRNTASNNTADGASALLNNTSGTGQTAVGAQALLNNTTGSFNTASGDAALYSNTTGARNIAVGVNALYSNTSGQRNIALGTRAGYSLTTGNDNIEIGNAGAAGDTATIRIGTQGTQTRTLIAGISGVPLSNGVAVVVNSNGQLGVAPSISSARFKRDIHDIGAQSDGLMKLRPVTFRYKQDPQGAKQYGLVAEEVERVYPDLVTYGEDGKLETVRYSMLPPMLLNEAQKQAKRIKALEDRNARQAEQINLLSAQIEKVTAKLSALQQAMNAKSGMGAIARTGR